MSSQKQAYLNENLRFNCLILLYIQTKRTEYLQHNLNFPTDSNSLPLVSYERMYRWSVLTNNIYNELPTLPTKLVILRLRVQLVCAGHGLHIGYLGNLERRFPYFLRRGVLFRREIRHGILSSPWHQRHVCAYLAVFT